MERKKLEKMGKSCLNPQAPSLKFWGGCRDLFWGPDPLEYGALLWQNLLVSCAESCARLQAQSVVQPSDHTCIIVLVDVLVSETTSITIALLIWS